jgi:hypothetical protein
MMAAKPHSRKSPLPSEASTGSFDGSEALKAKSEEIDTGGSAKRSGRRPAIPKTAQVYNAPITSKKPARLPALDKAARTPALLGKKASSIAIVTPKIGSKARVSARSVPQKETSSDCRIFQIYFEPWHLELLDPAFEPLNNCGVKSEFFEFDVFERVFSSEEAKATKLWGTLSWRFTEKTGMSGSELISEISAHPGYDIYYCNPYPHNESLFHNMWLQGETVHPRFLEIATAVFEASGLPPEHLYSVQKSETYSAANYFVATDAFWKAYIPFVKRIMGLAETKMSKPMRQLLHSSEADHRNMHSGASYVSFIIERLFPIFMKTAGRKLRGYKVPLPKREEEINIHLRLLREMKDMAHQTNSVWLAACWANYRNLYFSQTNGADWCSTYLRRITPPSINFG